MDKINAELVQILERRLDLIDQIQKIKQETRLPAHDVEREKEMKRLALSEVKKAHHTPFINEMLVAIFATNLNYIKSRNKI